MLEWKTSRRLLFVAATALFSCQRSGPFTPEAAEKEAVNSVRRYVYADADGKRFIITNSVPKGGGFTDSTGKRHPYTVFYTLVTNETDDPVEVSIDFPEDSLEIPASSGNYLKLLLPSEEMTLDKAALYDYGLEVQTYLSSHQPAPTSLKRTIFPNDSTAFYVVASSTRGVDGALRTGFRLQAQQLVYKIALYKSAPGHPLVGEQEIDAGIISISGLTLQK